MPIKPLPIINAYDKQRFSQFSPADIANWWIAQAPTGKKERALYPAMGRAHIQVNGINQLIFSTQPRKIFKSIDFAYVIVSNEIFQINSQFSVKEITIPEFGQQIGDLNFAYLPVIQIPVSGTTTQHVFCMLCDGKDIFVIDEQNQTTPMTVVTDINRPINPLVPFAFGNRFAVASRDSTQFQLAQINMGKSPFDPSKLFTIPGDQPVLFAQESGIIRAAAVLQNLLYLFCDFSTGIWSNNPSVFSSGSTTTTFPWRKNTSFQFNYGIADPDSLDVDFGMMVWLAQNRNGLVTFMMSTGQNPESISTKAVNTKLQQIVNNTVNTNLLLTNAQGFLYQYEDEIFYRCSIGNYVDYPTLDNASTAVSFEYNFATKSWQRCIEANGQRNRIVEHEYFSNRHLVTVQGESTVYEMSGSIYFNELRNPNEPNPQSNLAYLAYPMRYENVTPIISEDDYSEFITDWVQIDFVFGQNTYISWDNGYPNAVFIVGEVADSNGDPVYIVSEDGNFFLIKEGTSYPVLDDSIYSDLFKPHIELYVSDDGGISFYSADNLEFSPLGKYEWRMRWYQNGPSRNRVYKLICVSPAPIIVLGGIQNIRRVSGGAY